MSKICRTCLKTITSGCEFINTDISAYNLDITSTCNKLQNCVPELDLALVPGPVICTDCITTLNVAYKFKKQCLETDEAIRAYLQIPNCSYDSMKLLELVQENKEAKNVIVKTEHIDSVTVIEQPIFESYAACDDQNEDIKPIINMKIEDEASNEVYFQDEQNLLNIQAVEYDYRIPSNYFIDVENKFKCDMCSLGVRRRQELIKHKRTHVFKCNVCGIVIKTKGGLMTHIKSHTHKRFRCVSCTYSTNNKIVFMTHSMVHTGIKPFLCNKCNRRFASHYVFEKHIKKCHRPVYKCPTCDYSSTNSHSIKYHINTHTGKQFCCTKCNYQGNSMKQLQDHVTLHDNECHLCSFKTRYKIKLLSHLVYCVRKNKPKPQNSIENEEVHDGCPEHVNADSNSTSKCSEEEWDTQMEVETNNICNKATCGDDKTCSDSDLISTHMEKDVGNNSYNKEISVDANIDFNTKEKCDGEFEIDEQNLLDIQAVQYEYRIPSDYFIDVENKFKCDICALGFRRRQKLIQHRRTHVFKCNVCGIATKTKCGLMTHAKTHTDKRFSCESCTYSTNNKIAFMTHSIVHTGIKPFPCNQCDRRFVSYASAERHIKNRHRPVYKCPTCDYSTTNSYSLKTHIKIHTAGAPFSCTKCDYQGRTMQHLQVHVTIHDHECHLCSFKTRHEYKLLNHLVYCVRKNKPKPENTIETEEADNECPEHVNSDSDSTNKCGERKSDAQMEVETNSIYSKGTSDDDKIHTDSDLNSTHMEKEVGNNSYSKETNKINKVVDVIKCEQTEFIL